MLIQFLPSKACPAPVRRLFHAEPKGYAAPLGESRVRAADIGTDGAYRIIRIAVGQITIVISVTGHPMRDGSGTAEALMVASNSQSSHSVIQQSGNTVHVRVVSALLCEHLDRIQSQAGPDDVLIVDPRFAQDPTIERLARSLVATDEVEQGLSALYADAVCLAIVTRLLGMRCNRDLATTNRRRTALPKWRLKRVVEYIDAHLDGHITLADLAEAIGLTRMHFAAQFKIATGVRPHEYVLRRRIERAQELLRNSSLTLVDIALSVGFQTQAHFTTVFKRFAGETPHRWRCSTSDASNVPGLS
jgi:AraC family transcriptional regulator